MKRLLLLTAAIIPLLLFSACRHHDIIDPPDDTPPGMVTGLTALNGDMTVDLSWNYSRENDVEGYYVYVSNSYSGPYEKIGTTSKNKFTDNGVTNGNTYYYAVKAYDYNGNISRDYSPEEVRVTPRPERFNQYTFDYVSYPQNAGYSFADFRTYPYTDSKTDVFYENRQGTPYIKVWKDTDIQDMGSTIDIWDIAVAPTGGWVTSKDNSTKETRAIIGHTYIIWTVDNHFAKLRVSNFTGDRVIFDCSYQTVEGNPDLKPIKNRTERTPLVNDLLEK